MSSSSKDSSVSSAKANIHLLEMQYHNSRRQYSLAAAAGAEAEKHLDASSDLKTALVIKALRASTLALRRDSADGDIEAARRLFEDAIFLGQIMKGEESGEKRREGKVWEDKCHAWLWHLVMWRRRGRQALLVRRFGQEELLWSLRGENKNCASQKTVPESAKDESGMQAMLENVISMSAPHTPIHGTVVSTLPRLAYLGH